ncbi:MAG: 4Fe-4S dicluster domain-containing protein [Syntrophobacteraceae bacterium]
MILSRRALLQIAAGAAVSGAVLGLTTVGRAQNLVRPPGALDEPDFLASCSRCLRCLDACAPLAIKPASLFDGPANLGTPVLETNKCILCMECVRTCPTGALSKIPKGEIFLGTAVIMKDVCLAWLKTRRCKECEKACKPEAIVMESGRYPVVLAEKCNGCGICMRRCPTEPKSIYISSEGARRTHRQEGRILMAVEDRVGPYEVPPPPFSEWFKNRIEKLAERYSLLKK